MILSWTQAICDGCWQKRYPAREPSRIVEPFREAEVCSYCGHDTTSGIYVREDPATVPYPQEKKA